MKLELHVTFLYLLPIILFISELILRALPLQLLGGHLGGNQLFQTSCAQFCSEGASIKMFIVSQLKFLHGHHRKKKGTSSSHYFCVCSHLKKADFRLFFSTMSEDVMFCFLKLIINFCICLIFLNPVQILER